MGVTLPLRRSVSLRIRPLWRLSPPSRGPRSTGSLPGPPRGLKSNLKSRTCTAERESGASGEPANDVRTTVTLPAGMISDEGMGAVASLLRVQHEEVLAAYHRE